ncbi:MAG: hypothetical protein NTW76_09900 [Corynebacteriales bacterium]|nr:hypothetical protein [Mycobacteriales bacterium]
MNPTIILSGAPSAEELMCELLADPHRARVIEVHLAPNFCGIRYSHAHMDGVDCNVFMDLMFAALFEVPAVGSADVQTRVRLPLVRAGLALLMRGPAGALAAMKTMRSHVPQGNSVVCLPTDRRTNLEVFTVSATAARAYAKQVCEPGYRISASMVVSGALLQAIRSTLPADLHLPILFPVDCRRYLRPDSRVPGNFAGPVIVGDASMPLSLAEMNDRVRDAAESGAAFVAFAKNVWRQYGRRQNQALPFPTTAACGVSISNLMLMPVLSSLPWLPGHIPVAAAVNQTAHPVGIGINIDRVDDSVTVSLYDDAGLIDVCRVREIVETLIEPRSS